MDRCDVTGCPNPATVVIPVGPDMPRIVIDADGELTFEANLDAPALTYVTGRACPEHIDVVRMALRERHQPYAQRLREGRP